MNKIKYLGIVFIVLTLTGCFGKKVIVDHPELPQETGFYERVWVDPRIVYTDSILTVIQSQRVDSFLVDKPLKNFRDKIITVAFEVKEPSCFTSILLTDDRGKVLAVLAADELDRGQYKINLNRAGITIVQPDANRFFLKTDFCGFSITEEVPLP